MTSSMGLMTCVILSARRSNGLFCGRFFHDVLLKTRLVFDRFFLCVRLDEESARLSYTGILIIVTVNISFRANRDWWNHPVGIVLEIQTIRDILLEPAVYATE